MRAAVALTLWFFSTAVTAASAPALRGSQKPLGIAGLGVAAWCAIAGAWIIGWVE